MIFCGSRTGVFGWCEERKSGISFLSLLPVYHGTSDSTRGCTDIFSFSENLMKERVLHSIGKITNICSGQKTKQKKNDARKKRPENSGAGRAVKKSC